MRRVTVRLAGQDVVLKVPVPSRAQDLLAGLKGESTAAVERGHVALLQACALAWPWDADPATAWETLWDAGCSWGEVVAAVEAWCHALNAAMGLQVEAAQSAETFRGEPVGVGGGTP
jgi:hypothetical protein